MRVPDTAARGNILFRFAVSGCRLFAMQSADVVIIGGGIVGSSIAYHLTAAGCHNVLVLERESAQGKGSTGKSMGGVRAQFSTPLNIQMSMYSIAFYATMQERLGHESGYRPQGYLFLATTPAHLTYLRENVERQHAMGLSTVRLHSHDDIARQYPLLKTDDVLGASFCSTDGFVDPYLAMTGLMEKAKEQGTTLWKSAEVTSIDLDAKGVCGVQTSRGPVATRTIVNCAGAWGASVAAMVGLDLPVTPLKRMLVPSEPFADFPHTAPMIIDMSNGFHFRPESLGFLLAWNDAEEIRDYDTNFDPSFVEKILERAVERVPCFENLAVNPKRGWAGLYEMTPDHHPALGPVAAVQGFFCANGFSGHGVMHAPATGKILADLITTGKTTLIDAGILAFERFAEGRLVHETAVL
jgi:sarcosine oxidase, subunit beta